MPILLIGIGIILIVLNIKAVKDDKNKKVNFHDVLKEKDSTISDIEIKLMEVRKDMAETILELQTDIEEIKELIKINEDKNVKLSPDNVKEIEENVIASKFNDDKKEKVRLLLEKKLSDDDICKELSIGKGELLLIKKLLEN